MIPCNEATARQLHFAPVACLLPGKEVPRFPCSHGKAEFNALPRTVYAINQPASS